MGGAQLESHGEGGAFRNNDVLAAVNEVFREALTCETEEELGATCLAVAERLTGSKFGFIGELNAEGLFDTLAISNPGWESCAMSIAEARQKIVNMPLTGVDRATLKEKKSRIVNDLSGHPDSVGVPPGHPPIECFLGVPLKDGGEPIGMVGLGNKPGGYVLEDQRAVESLAEAIVQALWRKRAEERLAAQRAFLESIYQGAEVAIFVVDVTADGDFRFVGLNPAHERISGMSSDDVAGRTLDELTPMITAEGVAAVRANYRRCLEEGEPVQYEEVLPMDGRDVWWLTRLTPLKGAGGRTSRIIGTSLCIDDEKELQLELSRTVTALERSNRDLEQFAYAASHDLQEPLRKVQAFGDLLTRKFRDELPDEARDYVDRMQSAASRMRRLIDDLLAYSRVTKRGRPFVEVDLRENVDAALAALEIAVSEAETEIEVGALPTVEADPSQMTQLFQNLLGNALKFRKPGEPAIVRIEGESQGEVSEIRVRDHGIGFDERYLDRIFDVFQRLHGRDEYDGSGIGLALCARIAERHGGRISARSAPGEGATFTLTLPRRQERVPSRS